MRRTHLRSWLIITRGLHLLSLNLDCYYYGIATEMIMVNNFLANSQVITTSLGVSSIASKQQKANGN